MELELVMASIAHGDHHHAGTKDDDPVRSNSDHPIAVIRLTDHSVPRSNEFNGLKNICKNG